MYSFHTDQIHNDSSQHRLKFSCFLILWTHVNVACLSRLLVIHCMDTSLSHLVEQSRWLHFLQLAFCSMMHGQRPFKDTPHQLDAFYPFNQIARARLNRLLLAQLWRAPYTVWFRVITRNTISILIKSWCLWIIERSRIRVYFVGGCIALFLALEAMIALAYIANVEKY